LKKLHRKFGNMNLVTNKILSWIRNGCHMEKAHFSWSWKDFVESIFKLKQLRKLKSLAIIYISEIWV